TSENPPSPPLPAACVSPTGPTETLLSLGGATIGAEGVADAPAVDSIRSSGKLKLCPPCTLALAVTSAYPAFSAPTARVPGAIGEGTGCDRVVLRALEREGAEVARRGREVVPGRVLERDRRAGDRLAGRDVLHEPGHLRYRARRRSLGRLTAMECDRLALGHR